MPTTTDRYQGALLGLAAGDAVGTTLEFQPPGSFTPITDMVGGGVFQLQAGEWTDDTSMALCLAESLVECQGFHAHDQMTRYVRWWRTGEYSVTGTCFDIGGTVRAALQHFTQTGDPYAGVATGAGNGALMRLAPLPMAYARSSQLPALLAASSRTTHGGQQSVDACIVFGLLLADALQGADKAALLARLELIRMDGMPLHPEIAEIVGGSYLRKSPPAIRGAGYVVPALEAALWAFFSTDSYQAAVLAAANLGDDADTTAAIVGQLAGAVYGVQAIPAAWRAKLAWRDRLQHLAAGLEHLAGRLVDGRD